MCGFLQKKLTLKMSCQDKICDSHTNAIVMFSDQIQICLILLGPKETSGGCVWDFF